MYAMTGTLIAQNGKRGELVDILKNAAMLVGELPECLMYIVSEGQSNQTHVHVFEVWSDKQAHDSSLKNEKVRALIVAAKPLLASAPDGAELNVVGGHGL